MTTYFSVLTSAVSTVGKINSRIHVNNSNMFLDLAYERSQAAISSTNQL